jgi:hypothetical protein
MTPNYLCERCDYKCGDSSNWTKHLSTNKHLGKLKVSKELLACEKCDYACNKQSIMNKHKNTEKHKMKEAAIQKIEPSSDSDLMTIVKQLLSQNNELKNFIIEQANEHKRETFEIVNKVLDTVKPSIANTINNNNNQKFNINVFLNEQCKDAMNFSDFVKNLTVSREDLENNAQLGFVDGVSKILIDSLKQLDKTERPIHCTDMKRETMYIKDEDKWNKEEDATKINKAIQEVTRKSMISLLDWKGENPDYKDRDSEFSERCIVIQQQSMAAHNRDTYFPKVAKLVAKEVVLDK